MFKNTNSVAQILTLIFKSHMTTRLDHLVIAAANLEQGVEYLEQKIGIIAPFGGEHPKMGTHNHLIQLGNEVFLEIIAINPNAAPPERPRWFGLDDPLIQRSLQKSPRLLAWVVNCDDIKKTIQNAACSFGKPELITRGELSWHFGLPADGRLLAGGFLPYLIEWHTDSHPSKQMADAGVKLLEFEIEHPQAKWLGHHLAAIGTSDLVKISAATTGGRARFKAIFSTQNGIKELTS